MSFYQKTTSCLVCALSLLSIANASDFESRMSELEKQMLEVGVENVSGSFGARFGSTAISVLDAKWEVAADVLLWHCKTGGSEFAFSVDRVSEQGAPYPVKGAISEVDFNWDWGFRVSAGAHLSHDDWSLRLSYTRFHTADTEGGRKDLPSGFIGLTGFLDPSLRAKSHYNIAYEDVTFGIYKGYFLGEMFSVEPQIGLKSAWVSYRQRSSYEFDVRFNDLVSLASKLDDKSSFWGIGPNAEVITNLYIRNNFSFFYLLGGSLLFGYYKIEDAYSSEESRFVDAQLQHLSSQAVCSGSSHTVSPEIHMFLGFSWNHVFQKTRNYLKIMLGYEIEYFWRNNQTLEIEGVLSTSSSPTIFNSSAVRYHRDTEDVSFYGVTLRASYVF